MPSLSDNLTKLGLSPDEASIYCSLLKQGPTTALALSRDTGIKRPTVYNILESLKRRGLMHEELRGLKTLFAPASPNQFDAIIADHKRLFDDSLPEMLSLYKLRGSSATIKFYDGIESIKELYETLLKEIQTGDPYYIISRQENWLSIDQKWFEDYVERRSKRTLETKIIFQEGVRAKRNTELARVLRQEVKIAHFEKLLATDYIVCPQRFVIHTVKAPYQAVSIESTDVIQSQLLMFSMMWSLLPSS